MPFELQPLLAGKLVRLVPLRVEHWEPLFDAASDPLIWEQHPDSDRYQEQVFRAYFDGAIASGGAFAIVDATTGRVIGSSRYHGYDEAKSEVEIGWTFLVRSHWGGAVNRELKDLMLRHAFRFVRTVIFRAGPQNWRSQRAVEKIGGRRIGVSLDATGRESVVFAITADEYCGVGRELR